jgi:23S rRNA pseudouridine1911/1915/1917 synthase
VALVRGSPRELSGTVNLALAPDANRPGRMRVTPAGKPAETEYRQVVRWRRFARLDAHPLTGRQHQVRVHLASLGCPVLGDPFYGSGVGLLLSEIKRHYTRRGDEHEKPLIGRLALHAESLTLKHPETQEPITIVSPLPDDFMIAIKYLNRFAGTDPIRPPANPTPQEEA